MEINWKAGDISLPGRADESSDNPGIWVLNLRLWIWLRSQTIRDKHFYHGNYISTLWFYDSMIGSMCRLNIIVYEYDNHVVAY